MRKKRKREQNHKTVNKGEVMLIDNNIVLSSEALKALFEYINTDLSFFGLTTYFFASILKPSKQESKSHEYYTNI